MAPTRSLVSRLSCQPLRSSLQQTIFSRSCPNSVSSRSVATSRRTTKALRPTAAPSATAGSKYNQPATNTIVFNPPPSAPTPYHTPPLFLPPEDPRRALLLPSHAHSNPYATPGTSLSSRPLPPPISEPYEKKYHLTSEQIEEMRQLRRSDEWHWTRKRLADKFGCTEFFVGMCVQASDKRMEWSKQNLEAIKERWGDKRRVARLERLKRRVMWNQDA